MRAMLIRAGSSTGARDRGASHDERSGDIWGLGVAIERLEPIRASEHAVRSLGLDPDRSELHSPVAHAASVHRAASFMCPTSHGSLARAVAEAVSPLSGGFPDEDRGTSRRS